MATARQLGLVVHTDGVGNSLREGPSYRDARVAGLECPDQLPVNNQARVTARVAQVGLAGHVVQAVLEEDGKAVAEAAVELGTAEGPQEVSFQFVPAVQGRHTYTVRFPALPHETIVENNHRSAAAQVIDARIRVLYLEGALRAEYGALVQRFLSKDPDIEFCALVQTRPGVFVQRTNIEGLKLDGIPGDPAILGRFDVILLGDLDSSYWTPEAMALLVKRVREGGACLLMLGGYHSLGPGGYGGTALEEILPTFVGARVIGQMTEPFLPVLTPEGRAHPIFASIDGFFPSPTAPPREPGLHPPERLHARLGAQAGGDRPGRHPRHPDARVGRPARGPGAGGDVRFWGQMVRWLANRSQAVTAKAGVVARTDQAAYEPDEPVTVLAVVRDQDGEGTNTAQVQAQVTGPNNRGETV
ncbi:MAG TPA: hypothetical protein VF590_02490, partial [Isosphaeraceae bacterium]